MYDAIIVGGGVTGAATALLLGQQGRRVLVCDRGDIPADAVSTHFFGPSVLRFFDELGLLDELHATAAPALRHWHLQVESGYYGAPMLPRSSYPYNLCVRRRSLVEILLRRLESMPTVDIRPRANVRTMLWDGDRVVGLAGRSWEEHAPVVVGADGRSSRVADLVGAEMVFDAGVQRATVHAYWQGVAPLPQPSLELWHAGEAMIQVGPCDGGLWVVMLSLPIDQVIGSEHYVDYLRSVPGMEARIGPATMRSPIYSSGSLRNYHRRPAGPGWRLAGDAYCHKDPLFGAGIADACAAARTIAETSAETAAEGPDTDDADQAYAELLDERVGRRVRDGIEGLRTEATEPGQVAWINAVLSHPGLALEMKQQASMLFAGLPADRQAFWQRAADQAAELLGLPEPDRLPAAPPRTPDNGGTTAGRAAATAATEKASPDPRRSPARPTPAGRT